MTRAEISDKVSYVVPTESQLHALANMRDSAYDFLCVVEKFVHNGHEKSIAITKIEEALMWANKGITHTG